MRNLGGGGKVPYAKTVAFRDDSAAVQPEKYVVEDYYDKYMDDRRTRSQETASPVSKSRSLAAKGLFWLSATGVATTIPAKSGALYHPH